MEKRDLALNAETVKPCLTAVGFNNFQTISNAYRAPVSLTSADLNNDGLQDIAVAFSTLNQAVWYRNDGDDNWSSFLLGTVNGASSVFAADLNGDGNVDIVASSKTDNTVYWFKNTLTNWIKYTVGNVSQPQSVFVADINGDGKLDIVAGGASIAWFENNINNAAPSSWTGFSVGNSSEFSGVVESVFAVDIDKDGYIDIVASSSASDEVMWFPNSGIAFTAGPNTIAQPNTPVQVFCTDVDGDGYQDVLTVNPGENSTTLYYNNITGTHSADTFNTSAPASPGWVGVYVSQSQSDPASLFVADIDGNGSQDIVVAVNGSNIVQWFNSTNNYTWANHTAGTVTNPTFVFARDIADDASKDIIVASAVTNQIGWLEENCITSYPNDSSDSHAVGWGIVTGVVGGLLVLWILIAAVIAVHDFVKRQVRKEAEKRKKEARALVQPDHPHEDL